MTTDASARAANKALGFGALRDMRAARRRRYAEHVDWIENLYRVYLGVIFGGWGLALISGAVADVRVDAHAIAQIHRYGPAGLGLVVALALAGGLRSGSRGGPLVLEAADVQHVLLSPVDRGAALRGLAVRRLRTACFLGIVTGVIAGNFAFRRLPGPPAQWLFFGGMFGAAVAAGGVGAAMIASGRRLPRAAASMLAVLILGWSLADVLGRRVTSPASLLGQAALWPLHHAGDSFVFPLVGIAFVALAAGVGLAGVAGTSLEAAQRRAGLAAQLRFAVTTQDLRAVILLRRQLASEIPRSDPWLRLPPADGPRRVIWRRDWHSFLRWPLVRVVRVCVLAAVAGLSLLGAWRGTTPLLIVAALALMVAALDAVEPVGQEVDHPTRLELLPLGAGEVIRRHLVAPVALMVGATAIAVVTAIAAGAPAQLVGVLMVTAIPTAILALCCAAVSVTNDPFTYLLSPQIGYVQSGLPVALVLIGVSVPFFAARQAARHGYSPLATGFGFELAVLLLCAAVIAWLGYRTSKRFPVRS
ncbi:MAG TPA: hypothetical protein VG275_14080 [Solirubrobacteraceae bacterium]|jgi:hypothetical protein|nr:hypothetical protein [Solirubrobacteraceae bacterium]